MSLTKLRCWVPIAIFLFLVALPLEVFARPGGGGRGGGGPGFSRSGPASTGSMRGGHADRQDRRGDRHDNRSDRRDDRYDDRRDRREDRHDERREWHDDRWKRRMGATLTVAAFRGLSCASTRTVVNGVTYYGCGGSWYNRRYVGGQVTYVVVEAPPGT